MKHTRVQKRWEHAIDLTRLASVAARADFIDMQTWQQETVHRLM